MKRIAAMLTPALVVATWAMVVPGAGALEPGGSFTDDDGSVHEPAIEAALEAGITNGCGASRFCPGVAVTRGQMAGLMSRALDLPPAPTPSGFTDTAGVFHDDIERLAASGITSGCSTTRFCPSRPLTRGQMAAVLDRALTLAPTSAPSGFTDTAGVFHDEIERLAAAEIANGCGPTTFCPKRSVTRGQLASFLQRALGLTPITPDPRPVPPVPPATGGRTGNPDGSAPIPAGGGLVDTSSPDHVVGSGSPQSCTSAAVVAAIAQGGTITFDCGPNPLTIPMDQTARVFNNTDPDVVIDGGGLITLSGQGQRRILYMNTCDPELVWTTSHCQNQDHPRLTVQNLTFRDGNADSAGIDLDGGGGAIWVRGGRFKIVNSAFHANRCAPQGPDVAGGAVRVFGQFQGLPVFVTNSTFGGAGLGNECSNGGALGSIGVSMTLTNSMVTHNRATGNGANPPRANTPGGGNGGGIANDGNQFDLRIVDSVITDNVAPEGGGGVFFVSNDRTGHLIITDSTLQRNPSLGFETAGLPGIFYLGDGPPAVTGSTIE